MNQLRATISFEQLSDSAEDCGYMARFLVYLGDVEIYELAFNPAIHPDQDGEIDFTTDFIFQLGCGNEIRRRRDMVIITVSDKECNFATYKLPVNVCTQVFAQLAEWIATHNK